MRVDIWSDLVCPWCYLGKRRLELALAAHERAGEVEVLFHSFELDTEAAPSDHRPMRELIAQKYGLTPGEVARSQAHLTSLAASAGLEYHLEATRRVNTFDAHRLLHLARDLAAQGELAEALFASYFTEGRVIDEHEELVAIAAGAGLGEPEVRRVLGSDAYAEHVRRDEQAAVELGASGVPFFVFGGRYPVAGAQPPEVLAKVLDRVFEEGA